MRKNVKIDYFVKDLQNFVQEAKIEPNSSWSQIRIYGAKPIFKRPNLRNLAPRRPMWAPCWWSLFWSGLSDGALYILESDSSVVSECNIFVFYSNIQKISDRFLIVKECVTLFNSYLFNLRLFKNIRWTLNRSIKTHMAKKHSWV